MQRCGQQQDSCAQCRAHAGKAARACYTFGSDNCPSGLTPLLLRSGRGGSLGQVTGSGPPEDLLEDLHQEWGL